MNRDGQNFGGLQSITPQRVDYDPYNKMHLNAVRLLEMGKQDPHLRFNLPKHKEDTNVPVIQHIHDIHHQCWMESMLGVSTTAHVLKEGDAYVENRRVSDDCVNAARSKPKLVSSSPV